MLTIFLNILFFQKQMRGSRIKERIVMNTDINQYILDHIKRKLHPTNVCPKKKLKKQFDLLCSNLKIKSIQKTNRRSFIYDGGSQTQRGSKKLTRRKLLSQIQRRTNEDELGQERSQQVDLNIRLRNINDRALLYIEEQKLRNKQSTGLNQNKNRTNSNEQLCFSPIHPQHHRRIITSRLRPFDFGIVYNEVNSNRILVNQNEKLNIEEQKCKQRTKYKNSKDNSIDFNERRRDDKENVKKEQRNQYIKIQKKKAPNKQRITELNEDNIDLIFKQGLVEEIYETKRVKIRKKINNIRSKKNIYDGKLYFLKE